MSGQIKSKLFEVLESRWVLSGAPFDAVLQLETISGVTHDPATMEVTEWSDLSGSGNSVFGAGIQRPIYNAVQAPSGAPALSFDGIDDRLIRSLEDGPLNGLPSINASRSVFLVAQFHDASAITGASYGRFADNRAFGVGTASSAEGGTSDGKLAVDAWGAGYQYITDVAAFDSESTAGWMIISAIHEDDGSDPANNLRLFANGVEIGAWDADLNTRTNVASTLHGKSKSRIVLGEEIRELGHQEIDVAAFLIYDDALSDQDRQAVESYLETTYFSSNVPPVANDDSVTVSLGGSIVIDVLANDFDPNGTLDPSSVTIVSGPAHAANVQINPATGAITYVNDGLTLPDALNYVVQDDSGQLSNTATVTIDAAASTTGDDVYFVGNSLTLGLRLTDALQPFAIENGQSLSDEFTDHKDFSQFAGGASLYWHWYHKKYETNPPEWFIDEFGPELMNHTWDTLVLQPYSRTAYHYETSPLPVDPRFDTWQPPPREEGSLAMSNNFINMAFHHPDLRVVMYQTWPTAPTLPGSSDIDPDRFDFKTEWDDLSGTEMRTRQSFVQLMQGLRSEWDATLNSPIVLVPTGDVMYELNERLHAQPFVDADGTTYDDVEDFYVDHVHLKPGVGRYLMALTMYSVLYTEDPRGLSIGNYNDPSIYLAHFQSSFVAVSEPMRSMLQDVVWDVVSTHPFSGFGGGGNEDLPAEGLVFHLEATSGVVYDPQTSQVSRWDDQASGNDLFGTASQQPTFGTVHTPNGTPALEFDGIDDRLIRGWSSGPLSNLPEVNASRSVFLVARFTDADANGGATFGRFGDDKAFGLGVVANGADEGNLALDTWGAGNTLVANASGYDPQGGSNGWMILTAVHIDDGSNPADNTFLYKDGIEVGSWNGELNTRTNVTTTYHGESKSRIVLGEEVYELGHQQLDVAAWLIYDQALTAANRNAVEAYLGSKYFTSTSMAATNAAANYPVYFPASPTNHNDDQTSANAAHSPRIQSNSLGRSIDIAFERLAIQPTATLRLQASQEHGHVEDYENPPGELFPQLIDEVLTGIDETSSD